MISPVRWDGERLVLLDQTRLPTEEIDQACASWQEVAQAIKTLVVRGAPAIGVAAAFGVALAARQSPASDWDGFVADLDRAIAGLGATRPTAVNLFWALDRMRRCAAAHRDLPLDRVKVLLARGGRGDPRGGHRGQPRDGRPRRGPRAPGRARAHALQCRRARDGGLRHRARRRARGARAEEARLRLGGRDPARDAGLAAHRVGDGQGGDSRIASSPTSPPARRCGRGSSISS